MTVLSQYVNISGKFHSDIINSKGITGQKAYFRSIKGRQLKKWKGHSDSSLCTGWLPGQTLKGTEGRTDTKGYNITYQVTYLWRGIITCGGY